jgi:pimeloyl-ACP methyl ester carboxylesterase
MSLSANSWNSSEAHSALIPLNTHLVHVQASGPSPLPDEPAVLVLPGLGSTSLEWAAVTRQISSFSRTIIYDRPGYGKSTADQGRQHVITSSYAASELALLLEITGIQGPFVIVCHSWGAITARELLELGKKNKDITVVGMVFVDANTERSGDGDGNFAAKEVQAIISTLDFHTVLGHHAEHKLTTDEWQAVLAEEKRPEHQAAEQAEMEGVFDSYEDLREVRQFDRVPPILNARPISVLMGNTKRDFQKMYSAGVAAGNGTENERAFMMRLIDGWEERDRDIQGEILKLSSKGRISVAEHSGHSVHLTEPERIVEEVKWVLSNLRL